MDVHTHTLATHTEICNHVLEGKKLIKRFKLQQIVKKNHKRYSFYIASFEEDNEKAQYASFKHIFI